MAHDPSDIQTGPITNINVTPLVDITLVLLIIFMVTAQLIVSHQALGLELPQAATGSEVQPIFSLVLPRNGVIELDGEHLTLDDVVLAKARAALAHDAHLRAVIQADTEVSHGHVMHTLDLLRQAGVSRIGFAVISRRGTAGEAP